MRRCETCAWWTQGGPQLAVATRDPRPSEPNVGTCQANPPAVVPAHEGRHFSFFPVTAADRFCGAWRGKAGPDDGERVIGSGLVVVGLPKKAAA